MEKARSPICNGPRQPLAGLRAPALNWFKQIHVLNLESRSLTALTTDRYDNFSPAWSADGKWLYFLSNRTFISLVNHPGSRGRPNRSLTAKRNIYDPLASRPTFAVPAR